MSSLTSSKSASTTLSPPLPFASPVRLVGSPPAPAAPALGAVEGLAELHGAWVSALVLPLDGLDVVGLDGLLGGGDRRLDGGLVGRGHLVTQAP